MSTMPPFEAPARDSSPKNRLISPWGGRLVDLVASPEESEELRARASYLPSLQISRRSALDLELMASGAFSPLTRFMSRADHERVVGEMRLEADALFPVPVVLPAAASPELRLDTEIALRDGRNDLLAIMTVEEIYEWGRPGGRPAKYSALWTCGTLWSPKCMVGAKSTCRDGSRCCLRPAGPISPSCG